VDGRPRRADGFPGVERCAFVGPRPAGKVTPVVVLQAATREGGGRRRRCEVDLRAAAAKLGESKWRGALMPHVVFLVYTPDHGRLPMDARHNSKIRRELVQAWAETQLGKPAIRRQVLLRQASSDSHGSDGGKAAARLPGPA
jgi:hypothetical protein